MRFRFTQPLCCLLLLLSILALNTATVRADDDNDEADDYDVTARVARISLLKGEVSLRRAGSSGWEAARLNYPLVEGDTLSTAADARVEIQIDARNFVRVGGDSVLKVITLREEGVALSLAEGTATLRLARFEDDKEYFEIDAPRTTLAAEKRGLYRLDVARAGEVRITVRDGGRARIYSDTSGFTLRDKRTARLVYEGDEVGDWELSAAADFDEWDNWTDERERYLASRLQYENRERYYDRDVWGAEELDAYGEWVNAGTYGWVWRPHITVINNYSDWAPYRYGHWAWCPPYGWTWVADEPWGWAPYHYGRWVYYNNNWCWAPRGYGYNYRRSIWRPALVAFVYVPTSYGEQVCWYPLRHGQRDPRSGFYQRNFERLRALRSNELGNLQRTNPAYLRAVSALPVREFGTRGTRARPVPTELARRAITGEPVRGRLPITPTDNATRSVETTTGGRTRLSMARPAPVGPARTMPERPTGAAARAPGVSLDNELRRTRIYNNREPRFGSPASGGTSGASGGDSSAAPGTGAVLRPNRTSTRPSFGERGGGDTDNSDGANVGTRPARPMRQPRDERGGTVDNPRREERERMRRPGNQDADARPDMRDGDDASTPEPARRARPERPNRERTPDTPDVDSPRTGERPDTRERRPVERTEPPRQEQPRHERPQRQPDESRTEPPRYERPAPRIERPAPRYEPPPRQEQPRQEQPRQEQPRQEAPRHEAPPRSEPAPRQAERERPSEPARAPVHKDAPDRPDRPDNRR